MKDIQHLLRVALVFVLVILGFLILRKYLTPESYGKLGRYRAAAVEELKAKPIGYAGQQECQICHEEIFSEKTSSRHRTVGCETCHGALALHVEDPAQNAPRKFEGENLNKLCILCHAENISRPAAFPQINLTEHNPDENCNLCHNPHNPKIES